MDMKEAALDLCEEFSDWVILNTIFSGLYKRKRALDAAVVNILEVYDTPDPWDTGILLNEATKLAKRIIESLDAMGCYDNGILVYWPVHTKLNEGVVLKYDDPRKLDDGGLDE